MQRSDKRKVDGVAQNLQIVISDKSKHNDKMVNDKKDNGFK